MLNFTLEAFRDGGPFMFLQLTAGIVLGSLILAATVLATLRRRPPLSLWLLPLVPLLALGLAGAALGWSAVEGAVLKSEPAFRQSVLTYGLSDALWPAAFARGWIWILGTFIALGGTLAHLVAQRGEQGRWDGSVGGVAASVAVLGWIGSFSLGWSDGGPARSLFLSSGFLAVLAVLAVGSRAGVDQAGSSRASATRLAVGVGSLAAVWGLDGMVRIWQTIRVLEVLPWGATAYPVEVLHADIGAARAGVYGWPLSLGLLVAVALFVRPLLGHGALSRWGRVDLVGVVILVLALGGLARRTQSLVDYGTGEAFIEAAAPRYLGELETCSGGPSGIEGMWRLMLEVSDQGRSSVVGAEPVNEVDSQTLETVVRCLNHVVGNWEPDLLHPAESAYPGAKAGQDAPWRHELSIYLSGGRGE